MLGYMLFSLMFSKIGLLVIIIGLLYILYRRGGFPKLQFGGGSGNSTKCFSCEAQMPGVGHGTKCFSCEAQMPGVPHGNKCLSCEAGYPVR